MSTKKEKDELLEHKEHALELLNQYISSLIDSDSIHNGKADKFSYWLEDYIKFLQHESSFSPRSMKRYKKGDVIKVHLGYNIGSEEGGLHYCIVAENSNSINNPVITIIPLTSVKPRTDLSILRPTQIYLGNEIFNSLNLKLSTLKRHNQEQIDSLSKVIDEISTGSAVDNIRLNEINSALDAAEIELNLLSKIQKEISKMKNGSIALVNQITTVSKIRIYDPKTAHDVLSGVKLSNEKLDAIDKALANFLLKIE